MTSIWQISCSYSPALSNAHQQEVFCISSAFLTQSKPSCSQINSYPDLTKEEIGRQPVDFLRLMQRDLGWTKSRNAATCWLQQNQPESAEGFLRDDQTLGRLASHPISSVLGHWDTSQVAVPFAHSTLLWKFSLGAGGGKFQTEIHLKTHTLNFDAPKLNLEH